MQPDAMQPEPMQTSQREAIERHRAVEEALG